MLSIKYVLHFLYNNCDDGINLFKSVFYRKSDAIHIVSVWSAFQDYVLC